MPASHSIEHKHEEIWKNGTTGSALKDSMSSELQTIVKN